MPLRVGSATSVGRVRPTNEDALLVRAELGLFVVCDGMGGAAAGEVASHLAVETVAAHLDGAPPVERAAGHRPRTLALDRAIQAANRAIFDRARGDDALAGMGTTLVAAWAGDDVISIGHVGDSRAYLAGASGFSSVTSDHSLVEAQVRAGLISREQSLQSEHQNVLLRALGRDAHTEVELSERPLTPDDRLLLCTDGLTRMVPDGELAEILDRFRGDPQGACDHLIAEANARGGPDNITVVIVEFEPEGLRGLVGRLLGQ
jgi:protein phosphatase